MSVPGGSSTAGGTDREVQHGGTHTWVPSRGSDNGTAAHYLHPSISSIVLKNGKASGRPVASISARYALDRAAWEFRPRARWLSMSKVAAVAAEVSASGGVGGWRLDNVSEGGTMALNTKRPWQGPQR
jgi:hypothetical protein